MKKDFIAMLRENKEIDRHSHWSDCKKKLEGDWRYRLVESATAREDWFRDYIRILKDERKKEKERDKDHRHKDHHKSDKKDKDKKEDKHKDKSSKDSKSDKESSKEKKSRRSESVSRASSKDKHPAGEKEIGEIDDDEKSEKKNNDNSVSMSNVYNS